MPRPSGPKSNKDIRGFFKPRSSPPTSSSSQTPSQPEVASAPRSQPAAHSPSRPQNEESELSPAPKAPYSPFSGLPSSPITPLKPSSRRLDRNDEILGSDDEDADSDDSLESLSVFIKPKTGSGPAPHERDGNPLATPKAKRVASGSYKSPFQSKAQKHKFDLQSLMSHAQADDRATESARRADEILKKSAEEEMQTGDLGAVVRDSAMALLEGEDEEAKGEKVARAMTRSKAEGDRKWCYMFDAQRPPAATPQKAFPKAQAKGVWSLLAGAQGREQVFISGIPTTIVKKGKELPPELYLWILDRIYLEEQAQLRMHYTQLLVACQDNTRKLVQEFHIRRIFEGFGATRANLEEETLEISPEREELYPGRDWTSLTAFLRLLEEMAPNLDLDTAIYAIKVLLRMALDPITATTLRMEHSAALLALIDGLPEEISAWNASAKEICNSLLASIEDPTLRLQAINLIPISSLRAVDLRRRLAADAFFGTTKFGSQDPDSLLDLPDIISRLSNADFAISHTTDYQTLAALIGLMDIALNVCNFIKAKSNSEFDAQLDSLCRELKRMHDTISVNSVMARREAKVAIEGLHKRLTYAVRTRTPAKISIFDAEVKDEAGTSRQRDFMKRWADKKLENKKAASLSPLIPQEVPVTINMSGDIVI